VFPTSLIVKNIANQCQALKMPLAIGKRDPQMLRLFRPNPQRDAATGEHRKLSISWGTTQMGRLRRHGARGAYSTSSFCIFVTTRLTNPLIALCTLEGLKVSVIPVQTSCPLGAPST